MADNMMLDEWKWNWLNVYLVDGFVLRAPDTLANQKKYPQPSRLKEGFGFPQLHVVIATLLVSGCVVHIRSIKCSLGMDVLRAKTPDRVRAEFWSCLLTYNLIRAKMLQSCATGGRDPRSLSFTTMLQLLGTNWLLCAVIGVTSELAQLGEEASSSELVGHRPDRVEPRVNKRRPKVMALMTKPRREYHAELEAAPRT